MGCDRHMVLSDVPLYLSGRGANYPSSLLGGGVFATAHDGDFMQP